jgi:hypothetical protein
MSNLIQIKRSLTTATPASLANGELAYTANGDILYIGSNGAIVPIGGKRTPGTLTANQALVANSTSGIDKVITGNAVITTLWANGASGTNGQVLVTNGSAVYWGTGTSGSNTQVQFNDSGVANATSGFTFDKVANTLFVGNNVYTTTVNATTVNATSYTVGSSTIANSSGVYTTGTVNGAVLSVGSSTIANSTGVYAGIVNGSSITVGTSTIANSTGVYTGVVNGSSITVGSSTIANSSGIFTTGTTNAAILSVGSNFIANSTKVTFTGANIDATSATAALQNLNVSQNVNVIGNLTVNGNVTHGDSTSDTINPVARYANNIIPSANLSYNLGSSALYWNQVYSNNINANVASFSGNVSIAGNLTVAGNVTTTNVSSVIISDPLIYLAGNNYTSDLVDIGFVANYNNGTNRHTGLFRKASDNTYYLFYNLTQELDNVTVVNTADPTFTLSTLNAYLTSGALTTNTTSVRITANSTINVQITANTITGGTLTLSTALAGNSGGTGLSSITNNAILVGNSTTGFNQLSLGASGYVLQSNGTALVYDILDGGSF